MKWLTARRTRTMDESDIELGREYRDTVTGLAGAAVARHEYLAGCTRITLVYMHNGEPKEWTVDAPQLVEVGSEQPVTSERTGGDRPAPSPVQSGRGPAGG
jgi:hypothetical protein